MILEYDCTYFLWLTNLSLVSLFEIRVGKGVFQLINHTLIHQQ